ncbi:hypothetical protein B0T16DRAFT_326322 [Cercophora newfieldiana]|uniref:Abc transporter protein n=1 Tax=Cercophora newfieldiana TaxID=92897 RepID=A0AA39YAH2_9PEZI|nr:hypothetical protein B0T16DRAFT_326322 [Cercophora newfieldiana]
MGKPTDSMRPSDDALSLHATSTRPSDLFLDDDAPELQIDDLPPLYDEVTGPDNGDSSSAPLLPNPTPAPDAIFDVLSPLLTDHSGNQYFIDKRFDNDPKMLEYHVERWAKFPPRPFVRLHGTHSQNVENNGKKERKTVTDFDIQVELTPYLFSDARTFEAMREVRTPENSDKVRRGTVLAKRAPGSTQSIEVGLPAKPTLKEWCHRYHASHAGLKSFTVMRRMIGFDEEEVKRRLEILVRHTNYRGHLNISFPVQNQYTHLYNDVKINRWRLTTWIYWLCIFTLMFLFTWPYLFFRTKRFEVVTVDWAFSQHTQDGRKKYVTISEEQWFNLWGRAIHRAVLEKRQCTLDQQDLLASEGAAPQFGNTVVDGAMDFFRAGVSAMNEVNRHLGWGGDC